MQADGRLSAGKKRHFDIGPFDTLRPSCSKSLHRGLLGGESSRQVLAATLGLRGVGDLVFGVDARQKAIIVPLEHRSDASDFHSVDAMTDDSHDGTRITPPHPD